MTSRSALGNWLTKNCFLASRFARGNWWTNHCFLASRFARGNWWTNHYFLASGFARGNCWTNNDFLTSRFARGNWWTNHCFLSDTSIQHCGTLFRNFRFYRFFDDKTGSGHFQAMFPNIVIRKSTIPRRKRGLSTIFE